MKEECVFCKILKGELPSKKIFENDNFLAILTIQPQVDGHTILIAKQHFHTILDMQDNLGNDFVNALKQTTKELMDKYNAEGFNLHANGFRVADQLIDHFHIHIIPRKQGDGFKPCA